MYFILNLLQWSHLDFLRRPGSFNICRKLLQTICDGQHPFFFNGAMCREGNMRQRDCVRQEKLIRWSAWCWTRYSRCGRGVAGCCLRPAQLKDWQSVLFLEPSDGSAPPSWEGHESRLSYCTIRTFAEVYIPVFMAVLLFNYCFLCLRNSELKIPLQVLNKVCIYGNYP